MKSGSNNFIPGLKSASNARDLFAAMLKHVELDPEGAMVPKVGPVRRVVLFTEAVTDEVIKALESVPELPDLTRELQELRLVATSVTPKGLELLHQLLPHVAITLVPADDVGDFLSAADPQLDWVTRLKDATDEGGDSSPAASAAMHRLFKGRYGYDL